MTYTPELGWLVGLTLITASMWMPYILESFFRRGLLATMGNPSPDDPPMPAWADRAKRAHLNAVDNLVIFAPVLLVANVAGLTGGLVLGATKIYVAARIIHYVLYTAGVPVLRTVTFLVGFFATLVIGLATLGLI